MNTKENGFTLIELLIVMAIFAVIASISYTMLTASFKSQKITQKHSKQIIQMQKTLHYLERDITQIHHSSIVLDKARLTTKNLQNEQLVNIDYKIDDGKLIRTDQTFENNPVSLVLLKNITQSYFRVLDNKEKWHSKWPPKLDKNRYLKVIELRFGHPDWGIIKKLIPLNDAKTKS